MGWIQKCCETYDNNIHMVGKQDGKAVLAPLFCITAKAQIEITLSEDGDFLSAAVIPKDDCDTLIPVTEKSASRSGKSIFPHPLCEQLGYAALGQSCYAGHAQYSDYFNAYKEQLGRWADSPHSHYIVKAVYEYCKKETMITDLVNVGIISLDSCGMLEKAKINGTDYEKCLVRWRVRKLGIGECWLNSELFNCYSLFYSEENGDGENSMCYITGERVQAASGYPKGVLRNAYGAKLLSANDSSGFTYRGRFTKPDEAFSVGAVSSQKAHSALTWLTANQGVFYGPRTFVCWNPKGKRVVPFDNDLAYTDDDETDEPDRPYTLPQYSLRLRKAIAGARQELGDNEDIIIMAMEAATTGRLSVTYYSELASSDYLKRLEDWQLSCCWYRGYKDKAGIYRIFVAAPSIKDIVKFSYGTQQGDYVSADDNLLKEHSQRILHCIIGGAPLPYDIVNSITTKASRRSAYSPRNYERLLSIACALIRKHRNDLMKNNDNEGDEWTMELDVNRTDRSYLFGRLLAVAEKVERSAYDRGEIREPAALRLQAAFAAHPMRTWAILEKSLNPYYAKLRPGSRRFYRDLIGDIISGLEAASDAQLNRPLEDSYLLGYYLQRKELNAPRTDTTENAPIISEESIDL